VEMEDDGAYTLMELRPKAPCSGPTPPPFAPPGWCATTPKEVLYAPAAQFAAQKKQDSRTPGRG